MKFAIQVTVDTDDKRIKDGCLDVLARYLRWYTKGAHYVVCLKPEQDK